MYPKTQSPTDAYAEIERSMYLTLETYANVHRGAGFKSLATTAVYERARDILLDATGLNRKRFELLFCHPGTEPELLDGLPNDECRLLSSAELGLPLGVRAVAVERARLPALRPPMAGGGTVDMVSPHSVVWSDAPALFEAGTPAVVNTAAFASATVVAKAAGKRAFIEARGPALPVDEILGNGDLGDVAGPELLRRFRRSLIGRHFPVPTDDGRTGFVNLDNAASTPAPLPVWDSVRKTLRQNADVQKEIVSAVKRELAIFLGAPQEEYDILFTANTTGAINLAARFLASITGEGYATIVNTPFEHASNELPWRRIPGVRLMKTPLAASGHVATEELARMMRQRNPAQGSGAGRVVLVAMNGASNVTGERADIESMCAIAHRYGAMTLVDGAQLIAHQSLDLKRTGVDFFAFSGHKTYAPFGAGALVARRACMAGNPGVIQAIRAAGEENAVGIAAIGAAVRLLRRIGMKTIQCDESRLHRLMVRGFSSRPGIAVVLAHHGCTSSSARGVTSFRVTGIPHNLAARLLAEAGGIGTRAGCFCAHLFVKRLLGIHPLRAVVAELLLRVFPKYMKPLLPGLVRVSISAENDESDLDSFFTSLDRVMGIRQSLYVRVLSRFKNGVPVLPDTLTGWRTGMAIQERLREIFLLTSTLPVIRSESSASDRITSRMNPSFEGVDYVW